MTTQLVSEFTADDFVPGIAIKAEIAVQQRPSENTPLKLLLVGFQKSGTMTDNTEIIGPVLSEADCNTAAGAPSELARAFRASRAIDKEVETYLLAVPPGSGVAATASMTIGGTWSTAGWLTVWVDGEPVRVEVGAADATTAVATAVEDAWDLETESAVTVSTDSSTNTFECRDVTTRGNSKILYVDTANAPAGLTVSLLPPLGALLTIVNELRTDLLAHFALTAGSVHGGADSTSGASFGSAATTYATAIALVNLLRTGYAAHRVLTSGSVHGAADSTNVVLLSAATTAAEAVLLANDIKAKYNAHRVLVSGSVHGGSGDTTNVTSATDATDGAVAGDSDTGSGVSFAGGTGTESVATALALISADPRHFKRVCFSAIDATNLGLIETWSDERSAAMVMKPAAVVLAHNGTQSAAQAISKTQLNHEGFEVLWGRSAETPCFEIAAAHATQRIAVERNGPAGWNQSYSGTVQKGVRLARSVALRCNDHATQKSALKNGLSPLASNDAGETVVIRAVMSKCVNGDGSANYSNNDVAEYTTVMEVRERDANTWRFYRVKNPKVRDNFATGEPVVSGVATPIGYARFLAAANADLLGEGVYEAASVIKATYNPTTKRIQWVETFRRAPLHEQSEGVVQSTQG